MIAVDVDGRRPLHYAACHGVARVVSLLLGAGADESAVDSDGYSALHYACRWNQPNAVDILAWHVDVNATDSWGQTALHVAAASEGSQLVNVLVMRGARVAQQDNDGRTATDVATLHCDEAFKNAVRLATDEAAALAFGPGEFDIVNEMSSLTDELSLTQQIVAELYDLGDATAEQLDGMVAQLEVFGSDGAAAEARLGKSGPVGMGEFEALKLRLATDLELFKSSPAPNYAGAAATIVPGRDGRGTSFSANIYFSSIAASHTRHTMVPSNTDSKPAYLPVCTSTRVCTPAKITAPSWFRSLSSPGAPAASPSLPSRRATIPA